MIMKNKGILIPIGIFFAVLFLYVYEYNKWQDIPLEDPGYVDPSDKGTETNIKKLNDNNAKALYEKVAFKEIEKNYGKSFKDIYYNKGEISSEFMIYLAILNIEKNKFQTECNFKEEISETEVDMVIKELFGVKAYEKKSFTTDNLEIAYNQGYYIVETNNCASKPMNEEFIGGEYYSNTIKDGKLIITELAYLVSFGEDGALQYNYHSDVTKTSPIIGHDISLIDKTKFSKYDYIFSVDGNNYYFEGVTKVK